MFCLLDPKSLSWTVGRPYTLTPSLMVFCAVILGLGLAIVGVQRLAAQLSISGQIA